MKLFIILLLLFGSALPRRKSQARVAFEDNEGINWGMEFDEDGEEEEEANTIKSPEETILHVGNIVDTTTVSSDTTTSTEDPTDEMVRQMLEGNLDLANLTKLVEREHLKSLEDANKTIYWIDAFYKAEDAGVNISNLPECKAWNQHWNITIEETTNSTQKSKNKFTDDEMKKHLRESEVIDSKKRLKKLGLKEELLEDYEAVGIVFREICAGHNRILWFNSTEDAKKLGIDETSPICEPFKEDLNPDPEVLLTMADSLNYIIESRTYSRKDSNYTKPTGVRNRPATSLERKYLEYVDEEEHTTTLKPGGDPIPELAEETVEHAGSNQDQEKLNQAESSREKNSRSSTLKTTKTLKMEEGETVHFVEESDSSEDEGVVHRSDDNKVAIQPKVKTNKLDNVNEKEYDSGQEVKSYEDDIYDYKDFVKRFKEQKKSIRTRYNRKKRMAEKEDGTLEDDWVDPAETRAAVTEATETTEAPQVRNRTLDLIQLDVTDEINPILLFESHDATLGLHLNVEEELFARHEKVGLYLPGICADYVPKAVDSFNSSSFEGIEIEGPIGVNISALEAAGVNLTELAEKLRNDTEVDDILSRTLGSVKTLGGSFILPVLNKNQYDPFSAPIVFRGSAVVVRFGIYIESMSNFQTTTMDYDMDIYLLMAWRDARLVNPYDKPILVKEEEILDKLWRPDPFFANAKEAEFHEVTFLNFLMRIFPDGLVLYETRVKITPSCNLILCKYPHDKQTCDLLIKSFAYPVETVRFEWFSHRNHAIDKNPHVKLPELYIASYDTTTCDKSRKSGTFSCLRAVFKLKRDVGFHLAQTYVPTSLALMFSWVGVWLPEEFMEGRIGVAITVLLTLSTESAGAREHLPSVSYLKAIDLWFGFITGFVFITLLQTLFVIGFDKKSSQMRKAALKIKSDITEEKREEMLYKAKRYHKTGRKLDNFCRVFYPLCFIIFLILYYFVYTEGRQDDCINRNTAFDGI